ncbi:hypothetical protein QTI66_03730 [Variovorax sp. J22R133]|uniref:hypothetical protein n=1 Tax=Variovorax brevis TaxID=3053503 RepID=UPI002575B6B8|nr:hypothetical protein [Variovorax sp. J22R133]MDM0111242.1 hypothetical protein [Variovorax sp. J22R133]
MGIHALLEIILMRVVSTVSCIKLTTAGWRGLFDSKGTPAPAMAGLASRRLQRPWLPLETINAACIEINDSASPNQRQASAENSMADTLMAREAAATSRTQCGHIDARAVQRGLNARSMAGQPWVADVSFGP